MSIDYKGNKLWGEGNQLHYICGCPYISGCSVCPKHSEPLKEQMIYGNDTINRLDEKEYKQNILNEGFVEGDY